MRNGAPTRADRDRGGLTRFANLRRLPWQAELAAATRGHTLQRCSEGAGAGDLLVIEAVEQITPDRCSAAVEFGSLTRQRPRTPAE